MYGYLWNNHHIEISIYNQLQLVFRAITLQMFHEFPQFVQVVTKPRSRKDRNPSLPVGPRSSFSIVNGRSPGSDFLELPDLPYMFGLNFREYPHNSYGQKYGTFTYLQFRIYLLVIWLTVCELEAMAQTKVRGFTQLYW